MWNKVRLFCLVTFSLWMSAGCSDDTSSTLSKESAPTEENVVDAKAVEAQSDVSSDESKTADESADNSDKQKQQEKPEAEALQPAPRIEGPVALINGREINKTKFYEELDKAAKHGAKIPPERVARIRANILNRMIEDELIEQAVKEEKISISKNELNKAFEEYRAKFKSDDQFDNYLKHGKHSEGTIKDRIRQKKSLERLIDKRGSLKITKAEIEEFYEKNKKFYFEKEAVHARHILFKLKPDAQKSEVKRAKKKVERVQKLIRKGVNFETLAKEFSEGPTGPKGGDLGFFRRGQMVKPFEEAAFELKVNEISMPVRTKFGYHLIQVVERREETQKPLKEVKDQIRASLKNKRFFQERRKLLEKLKSDAKIVNNIDG